MTDEKITPVSGDFTLSHLGVYLDGWADLVEGMGGEEETVREAILKQLTPKKMPAVKLGKKQGFSTLSGDKYRIYLTATKSPGITTIVTVKQHGTDLYISWRTFIRPVLNWLLLLVIIIASVVIGWFASRNIGGWLLSSNLVLYTVSPLALLILVAITSKLGDILHQNPAHFFLVRVTWITADDITALSLAVHKAIFRAFDLVGIDTSKLRLKEKFSGGRKGEDI